IDCEGHIQVVGPHHDDVVAVVGDGGGDGAAPEPVALEIADADVPGVLVPFHHGNFQNVPLEIHSGGISAVRGGDLPVYHPDDAPGPLTGKAVRCEPGDMERIPGPAAEVRLHGGV